MYKEKCVLCCNGFCWLSNTIARNLCYHFNVASCIVKNLMNCIAQLFVIESIHLFILWSYYYLMGTRKWEKNMRNYLFLGHLDYVRVCVCVTRALVMGIFKNTEKSESCTKFSGRSMFWCFNGVKLNYFNDKRLWSGSLQRWQQVPLLLTWFNWDCGMMVCISNRIYGIACDLISRQCRNFNRDLTPPPPPNTHTQSIELKVWASKHTPLFVGVIGYSCDNMGPLLLAWNYFNDSVAKDHIPCKLA